MSKESKETMEFEYKYKYHTVVFEGIDKTGKDQLARYVDEICGHWLCLPRRGVVSNRAYAYLYNRPVPVYDLKQHENEVYVLLRCDKEDWKIRCKLTHEPVIDYRSNADAFEKAWGEFKGERLNTPWLNLEFDTSSMTPYQIASAIVKHLVELNEEEAKKQKAELVAKKKAEEESEKVEKEKPDESSTNANV